MAEAKMTKAHNEYVAQQIATFNTSPTVISRELANTKQMEQYGLMPVSVTSQRIHAIIEKLSPEDTKERQQRFLADFSKIPLSHKKMRVRELVGMYSQATDGIMVKSVWVRDGKESRFETVECSDAEVVQLRQSILKDISVEMGENLEKMRSNTNINITFKSPEEINGRINQANRLLPMRN